MVVDVIRKEGRISGGCVEGSIDKQRETAVSLCGWASSFESLKR